MRICSSLFALLASLSLGACAGTAPPAAPDAGPSASLVNPAAWRVGGDDPFPAHREDGASCDEGGVHPGGAWLEVETGPCGYAVLSQPLLAPVDAGARVSIVGWHNALLALRPARAHLALAVDGVPWLEVVRPLPAGAGSFETVVEVPADAPAGAAVTLHLHNHGANAWYLVDVAPAAD